MQEKSLPNSEGPYLKIILQLIPGPSVYLGILSVSIISFAIQAISPNEQMNLPVNGSPCCKSSFNFSRLFATAISPEVIISGSFPGIAGIPFITSPP